MKIDFTQFDAPIDGLTLSDWKRSNGLEISPEDAALAGISLEDLDSELALAATNVDFNFTPDHRLEFSAASVVADVRSNNSLRSVRVRSEFLAPAEICDLAKPIIKNWKLHSFEDMEDDFDENLDGDYEDAEPPKKIDAIAELENWRGNQPDTLPSFLAQSDPNPFPGIWFFRLIISSSPKNNSLYRLSIQSFWRDAEFDKKHQDTTFWERADAVIHLANDQSSDESVSRVADSLLYAAARYNAFDYWHFHENATDFSDSRQEAIDDCVKRFRKMLEDNFDDHLDRYAESESDE